MVKNAKLVSFLVFVLLVIGNYNITIYNLEASTTTIQSSIDIQQSIVLSNNTELEQFINYYHFSGSGTSTSPYIIENLIFSIIYNEPPGFNQSNLPLLTLKNTDNYLIIKNCSFENGNYIFAGMVNFDNVSNVQVLQNTFNSPNQVTGLSIINSGNILIKDNYFENSGGGIFIQTYSAQLNISRSESYKRVEITNNYFQGNYDGIYLADYFNVSINNNYFKDISNDAICNQQSPSESSLNVSYNIFDSAGYGIYFTYTFGIFQLYSNHFFNTTNFAIYYFSQNKGSIFNNNFVFNNSIYNENAIYSNSPQPNLKLSNGTTGNYYSGYKGNSKKSGIPSGYNIYQYDQFPLDRPVNFNITIDGKVYLLPFFKTNNLFDQLFPYVITFASIIVLLVLITIYVKKKGGHIKFL